MAHFAESSLSDLYDSAVRAFPRTRMRQHAVQPLAVESLRWLPFLGLRTLFVKGEVRNETRHYGPVVLFKNVDYGGSGVKVRDSYGRDVSFAPLAAEGTDVLVRCDCPDFRWRFAWYNKLDHSLYGSPPRKYVATGSGPPANPLRMEGMCKHLMKIAEALQHAGVFLGD